jgi:hypothetical protein
LYFCAPYKALSGKLHYMPQATAFGI